MIVNDTITTVNKPDYIATANTAIELLSLNGIDTVIAVVINDTITTTRNPDYTITTNTALELSSLNDELTTNDFVICHLFHINDRTVTKKTMYCQQRQHWNNV